MILRARAILPVSREPIDNAALVVHSGRIVWAGRWRDCEEKGRLETRDLGEVVLLPGFINAHCHLDYTGMAGKLPPPREFPEWVKMILSLKAHWSYTDYAESWLEGAKMLVQSGTTSVCDIETFPELLPDVWSSTPLRVVSFLEITGVRDKRPPSEIVQDAVRTIESLPEHPKSRPALSPHALYSTLPGTMQAAAAEARRGKLLLSTHLAESEAEYEMFATARGPLFSWLRQQRPASDCGTGSPVRVAHSYGLLGLDCIVAHANYLAPGDAEVLAATRSTVVHCPRSHEYFGHAPFQWDNLREAGVNLCLGTDSLASTRKNGTEAPRLDLWPEMRLFAKKNPGVRPRDIFEAVTLNPARALGSQSEAGQIAAGLHADLISIPYNGLVRDHAIYEQVLYEGNVREVFIAGESVHS